MKRELQVLIESSNLFENVVYGSRTRSRVGFTSVQKRVQKCIPVRIGEQYQAVIPAWSPGQQATCRDDTWIDVEHDLKMSVYSKEESTKIEISSSL